MDFYSFIVQNKEAIKLVYALLVIFICIMIVLKTDRLFRISEHNGIRYFRNAFFFFGSGFAIRYFLPLPFNRFDLLPQYSFLIEILFEFALIIAGFFLLYSLIWKKFEIRTRSSLLNGRIAVFYAMTLILVLLDFILGFFYLMFLSQIIIFAYLIVLSYKNYMERGNKHNFPRFYFFAMLLGFFAWFLNALSALYFKWNNLMLINTYGFNLIFFLLFLYGVVKVTRE